MDLLGEEMIEYARIGDSDGVMQMLRDGADVNYRNRLGETALIRASTNVDRGLPIVKILLDSGANVSIKNNDGNTALILATWSTEKMLYTSAMVGMFDDTSTKQNRSKVNRMYRRLNLLIQTLLNSGADPFMVDPGGDTPYDIAMELGNSELAELLKYNKILDESPDEPDYELMKEESARYIQSVMRGRQTRQKRKLTKRRYGQWATPTTKREKMRRWIDLTKMYSEDDPIRGYEQFSIYPERLLQDQTKQEKDMNEIAEYLNDIGQYGGYRKKIKLKYNKRSRW